MSQNNAPPVFAVHIHQKQHKADDCDEIREYESWLDAALTARYEAEDRGVLPLEHGCLTEDDLFRLRELDAGNCILTVLRSREWSVSTTVETEDPELDGTVSFELVNPCAKNVDGRTVILVRRVYSLEPDAVCD